jgi:hypothetical protein
MGQGTVINIAKKWKLVNNENHKIHNERNEIIMVFNEELKPYCTNDNTIIKNTYLPAIEFEYIHHTVAF